MFTHRICTLYEHLRIVETDQSAWRQLREFHYRPGPAGAVDKVFALYLAASAADTIWRPWLANHDRAVGVIIYAMPIANVALRNQATNNRYVGWGRRDQALKLLNREIRSISRVVIHPQFRGIGLARYLVRRTLTRAGTIFVEALAAMGRVNPFFARAGMKAYQAPPSPPACRMLEAFAHLGIEKKYLLDPVSLSAALAKLNASEQIFIERQMAVFCQAYRGPRARRRKPKFDEMIRKVISHLFTQPVYYLWRKP